MAVMKIEFIRQHQVTSSSNEVLGIYGEEKYVTLFDDKVVSSKEVHKLIENDKLDDERILVLDSKSFDKLDKLLKGYIYGSK